MTVSVIEAIDAIVTTGTTISPALVSTPSAGDVLAVAFASSGATARTVSSVSGCGAVWAPGYLSGDGIEIWIGLGPTASGTVTVTQSGSSAAQVQLYNLRGLVGTVVVLGTAFAAGTVNGAQTGPANTSRVGHLALEIFTTVSTSVTMTWPNGATAPTTGWTTVASALSGGTAVRYATAYRIPTETNPTSHRIDYSSSGSATRRVAQVTIFGENSYQDAILADSPAAWYRLGEASGTVAADSSGNARDGVINGSPTLGVAGALTGDSDTAMTFNAGSDNVSVAYASWMILSSFMLECWYKGTGNSQILGGRGSANTVGYLFIDANGKAGFQSRTSGGVNQNIVAPDVLINDGTWHHIVGYRNGTGLGLYVDGKRQLNITVTGANGAIATDTTNGLYIATRNVADSTRLVGSVDEFAIWPSTFLSAERVKAHYLLGKATRNENAYRTAVLADSPLAYYRLNEVVSPAQDSSGNARHANSETGTSPTKGISGLIPNSTDTSYDFSQGAVVVNDAAWMDVTSITIEAIVQADSYTGNRSIVQHDEDASPAGECEWRMRTASGKFNALLKGSGAIDGVTGVSTLVAGTTYHLAMTYDGTTLKSYIDGVLDDSKAITGPLNIAGGKNLYIGRLATFSTESWDGRIDEVAIYGAALTQSQLAAHVTAMTSAGLVTINGGTAAETDAALTGAVSQTLTGGVAAETDTALDGTLDLTTRIAGGVAAETDTALTGELLLVVVGGTANETDAGLIGTVATVLHGGIAEETDTAESGSALTTVHGGVAEETDQALTGLNGSIIAGGVAEELDTAASGVPLFYVSGGIAQETDAALAGSVPIVILGGIAEEIESALAGETFDIILQSPVTVTFTISNEIILDPDNVYISSAIPILEMPSGTRDIDLTDVGQRWYKFNVSEANATTFVTDSTAVTVTLYTSPVAEPTPDTTLTELWATGDGFPYAIPDALIGETIYVEVSN